MSAGQHRSSTLQIKVLILVAASFVAGCYVGESFCECTARAAPPALPPMSSFEERGPPTKQELGRAGWTLLHTIAANFPDAPTKSQQANVDTFLRALGHLYPCPDCAAHFRNHYEYHPIASSSRTALSMWLCSAHNEVNRRNGKEDFYCDLGVLDARWKDCGCGGENHTSAARTIYTQKSLSLSKQSNRRRKGPRRLRSDLSDHGTPRA